MKSLAKPELPGSSYEPDSALVADIAIKYRLDRQKLANVLALFGPLRLSEQAELAYDLVRALARFQSLGANVQTVTDDQTRKQIVAVRNATTRLLRLLGFSPADPLGRELLGTLPNLSAADFVSILDRNAAGQDSMVGNVVRMKLTIPASAFESRDKLDAHGLRCTEEKLKANAERCNDAIRSLWWIHDRATASLDPTHVGEGTNTHGGARRRRTQVGQLVEDALIAYAKTRRRNPESGNKPGFGGPMLSFVAAVADLCGIKIADSLVKEVWRDKPEWQSKLE